MSLDQHVQIDLMKAIKDNMSQYIGNSDCDDDGDDQIVDVSIDEGTVMDDDDGGGEDNGDVDVNCTFATMDGISDIDTAPNTPVLKVAKAKQIPVQMVEDDVVVDDTDEGTFEGNSSSSNSSSSSASIRTNTNINTIKAVEVLNIANTNDAVVEEQSLPLPENQTMTNTGTHSMMGQMTIACQECDKQKLFISKLQKDISNAIQRYQRHHYYHYYHYYHDNTNITAS